MVSLCKPFYDGDVIVPSIFLLCLFFFLEAVGLVLHIYDANLFVILIMINTGVFIFVLFGKPLVFVLKDIYTRRDEYTSNEKILFGASFVLLLLVVFLTCIMLALLIVGLVS